MIMQTQSKVIVQSISLTPKLKRFPRSLPPRGSRDPLGLAVGGAFRYKDARHCTGLSLGRLFVAGDFGKDVSFWV